MEGSRRALSAARLEGGAALRLDANHAHVRVERLGGESGACDQSAAADRNDDHVDVRHLHEITRDHTRSLEITSTCVRHLLEDLHPHRARTGEDLGVVEAVDVLEPLVPRVVRVLARLGRRGEGRCENV